ncbi:MAG: hypothetical protein ACM3RP_02520 [Chitinophagales bacterium]
MGSKRAGEIVAVVVVALALIALWGGARTKAIPAFRLRPARAMAAAPAPRAAYTPSRYFSDLGNLVLSDPASAVKKAAQLYEDHFAAAPPAIREEAFLRFREFHRTVEERANRAMQTRLQELFRTTSAGKGFASVKQLAAEMNAGEEYRAAGLALVYEGEGAWTVTAAEGFYTRTFGEWLSPAYRDFLALEDVENNHRWAMDAALVIPLEELGRRLAAWETYRRKYPDSPFALVAKRNYVNQLSAFLFGLDNTPPFDRATKKVRPAVVEALTGYVAANPGTPSAKLAAQVLELYKKHKYVYDEALRKELGQLSAAARQ